MNHLKSSPVGIDKPIQRLQKALYNKLEFDEGYGRIYKVERDARKEIPAFFLNKIDYKEVLTNDRINGSFFFVEYYRTLQDGPMLETEVDIIFQMNLKLMKPNISHRADEEMRVDILKAIEPYRFFNITDIVKGRNALNGFFHRLQDMQPFSYLKLTGKIKYQTNC